MKRGFFMKIVLIRSNPVAPDSRVEKEAESLTKVGHKVIILAWDRSSAYDIKEDTISNLYGESIIYRFGIPAKFGAGLRNFTALLKFQVTTRNWLLHNQDKYDVIHACDLDTGIIAKYVAKKTNKKFVYDVFDYFSACHYIPFKLEWLISRYENYIISQADATIICSEQRIQQINGSRSKNLVIIHNSPHRQIISSSSRPFLLINSGIVRFKIGYVGILSRVRLLEDIVSCVKNRHDVELHIGGFGQLETYMEKASVECDNIFYYGKLSYPDTLKLEAQMDILTAIYDPSIPNHKFAAPNKFYEALMLGKPLIMAHNTGMDVVVDKEKIGITIDYSKEGFNAGLNSIIELKEKWPEIAKREMDLFVSKYSWNIMEKRLHELYEQL